MIKIGDKVRLHPESEFFGDGPNNPTDRTGEVIRIDGGVLPIWVDWGDDLERNTYEEVDLYVVNEEQNPERSVATGGASSNADDKIEKENYEYERGNE